MIYYNIGILFLLLILLYLLMRKPKEEKKINPQEANEVINKYKKEEPNQKLIQNLIMFEKTIPQENYMKHESDLPIVSINEKSTMNKILNDELFEKNEDMFNLTDSIKSEINKTVKSRLGNLIDRIDKYDKDGRIVLPLDAIDYMNGNLKPIVLIDGTIRVQNLIPFEENIYLALENKSPLFIINNCENKDCNTRKEIVRLTPEQLEIIVLNEEQSHYVNMITNFKQDNKKQNEELLKLKELNNKLEEENEILVSSKNDLVFENDSLRRKLEFDKHEIEILKEQLDKYTDKLFNDAYIITDENLEINDASYYTHSKEENKVPNQTEIKQQKKSQTKSEQIKEEVNLSQEKDLHLTEKDKKPNTNQLPQEKEESKEENKVSKQTEITQQDKAQVTQEPIKEEIKTLQEKISHQTNKNEKINTDELPHAKEEKQVSNKTKIKQQDKPQIPQESKKEVVEFKPQNELEEFLGIKVENQKNTTTEKKEKPKYTKKANPTILKLLQNRILSEKNYLSQTEVPAKVKYFGYKKNGDNIDLYLSTQHLKRTLKNIIQENYQTNELLLDKEIDILINEQRAITTFYFSTSKTDGKLYRFLITKLSFEKAKLYGLPKGDIFSFPFTKDEAFENIKQEAKKEQWQPIADAIKSESFLPIRAIHETL